MLAAYRAAGIRRGGLPIMQLLSIQLLGGFRIAVAEQALAGFQQPRLQALLAYLLLQRGTPVLRRSIAFAFWPDSSEAQARTNLRKLLHALRRLLPTPDAYLALTAETVLWRTDAAYHLDVETVERNLAHAAADGPTAIADRQAAVAAYTGDLLPGFYDEWLLTARERLRAAHAAALAALVTDAAATGDLTRATAYAHQLLQHEPLHESGYRLLMQLYLDRDDRAAALRVYHACAAILREELGADPSPATEALYSAAIQGSTAPTPSTPSLTGAIPLVGRSEVWQHLYQAWQAAEKGRPRLVLIQGEAGVGKTRLAEELADLVRRQNGMALAARAFEAQGGGAYAPLAELLRAAPLRRALSTLAPLWRSELARLLPELLAADPDLPVPAPITEDWQRLRLHEALARACLSAPPLLLHLDDLQWSDTATLDWLHFLLHFDPTARLLVVATARDEEVDERHPLRRVVRDLQRRELCSLIDLAPLSSADVAVLATAVTGRAWTPEAAAALYATTAGNPLFVVETLRAGDLSAPGQPDRSRPGLPPKVHAVLTQRLAQLSPAARRLAHAAAVIGRSFDVDLLVAATPELLPAERMGALDELWRRRIVREQGADGYDFSHDRLRDVAYGEIGPGARRLLHDQVATALIARAGPDGDARSGQIAVHAEYAGRRDLAAAYYRRAGDHAARAFAHNEALAQFERSLACLDDRAWQTAVAVRLQMEEVYARTADAEPRRANLQALQALLDRFPVGPESGALAAMGWADYYGQVSAFDQGVASAQRAVMLARAAAVPLLEAEAMYTLGSNQWSLGRMEEAQSALAQAIRAARVYHDEGLEARALEILAACGMFSGLPAADIERYLQRCRAIHERYGNLYGQVRIDNKLGYLSCAQSEGDYGATIQRFKQAVDVAHRIAAAQWEAILISNLGWVHTLEGDYAAAGDWLRHALDLTRANQDALREAIVHGLLGELAFNRADLPAALAHSVTALQMIDRLGSQHWRGRFLPVLGWYYWWDGAPERGQATLVEALDLACTLADRRFEATARVRLAHVQLSAGDVDAAEANYAAAWTLRRDLAMTNLSMEAVAGLAEVAWRRQDLPQTCAHLDAIVTHVTQRRLDQTEEALLALATTHRLLTALDDPRAAAVYRLAHAQIHRRAATLDGPGCDRFWRTPLHSAFANPLP